MRFTKVHALGNDFLIVGPADRADPASPGALARRICERHTGVGADGLIFLEPEAGDPVRARFRIFNADGSEAEISGNGLRCAGAFLVSTGAAPSGVATRSLAPDRACASCNETRRASPPLLWLRRARAKSTRISRMTWADTA